MPRQEPKRGYLTQDEVASLLRAAKKSPHYGERNYAMILLTYRHGMRANELGGSAFAIKNVLSLGNARCSPQANVDYFDSGRTQ